MPDSPSFNSDAPIRLILFSNGTQLSTVEAPVLSVHVSKQINKIPFAQIVVADGDMPNQDFPLSNGDAFKPGAVIKINAGYGDNEATIFEGIVTKHCVKVTGNNYSRLIVECKDKAVKLTVGRKNANYIESRDSEIISKLLSDNGLANEVETTECTHQELVQYYCSDWDFILSRAEVNGLLTIVENGKVSVTSLQTSTPPALGVTYGLDLIEFQAELDAESQLSSVKGTSWDLKNQQVVEVEETPQTLNRQGDLSSEELAKTIGLRSYRLQTSAPVAREMLDSWAQGCQIKSGLARIRGTLVFQGNAAAKIGSLIHLSGVGNRFNGDVFVTAINHEISEGNWLTKADFGLSPQWFSERRDLVAPPASGLLPGVEGLLIGVVTKLDGDPEGENKIQVKVPVLQAEPQGVWARLAQFHASEGFGALFVPEIGDEVILGYFNNDPCHPVILGSLYSSKRPPPYPIDANNNIKAVVTKSKLKLEFEEEKKMITLITPANNRLIISDTDKSILLQDENNNKVELHPEGILLQSPKDISVSAQGKISLEAVQQISIKSKADINISGLNITQEAQVGVTAKGNATAELSASGQTTIKGAMVMIN
ncbi:type VI secretion system tip protein VgrG [Desulfobulbus propionicus]